MSRTSTSKQQMLDYINKISFAAIDASLYLDTHPNDEDALHFFHHFNKLRNNALKEYAQMYAPLTLDTNLNHCQSWAWLKEPWPWETGGAC